MLVFLIFWVNILYAEVRIEITQGVNLARPIAIIPFKWLGPGRIPEEIASIVSADLRNSGKFNPIDVLRMPQQPENLVEVISTAWTVLGIDAILLGKIQPNVNGDYVISYQLINTSGIGDLVLVQNKYKVTKQWLRYTAHAISDEVFKKLTGIKGAFRTRIAYIVETSNDSRFPYELCVSDYDGYNQITIHRSSQPLMSPAWSADGSKIAYVTFENGKSTLVMQTLANYSIKPIASFPRHNGAPAFSPDGSKLAFALSKSGSLNIYLMNLASGSISQITNNHSNNTEPSWFQDSKHIAYTSDQSGHPQIYKIHINGGSPERITWEGTQNQDVDVSFDSKSLIMVSSKNRSQHIIKQNLATGDIQVLTNTFLDETPSIAPNGTMVIYSSTKELGSVLQLVSTDGRFKANLPATNGQVKFPAWSPYL